MPLTWELTSAGPNGTISTGVWTAPSEAAVVTLKATVNSGPSQGAWVEINRSVYTPVIRFVDFDPASRYHHSNNHTIASAGFIVRIYADPKEVSFETIKVRERNYDPTANGANGVDGIFWKWVYSDPPGDYIHVAKDPWTFGPGNHDTGSPADGGDQAEFNIDGPFSGRYQFGTRVIDFAGGSLTWHIPWEYSCDGGLTWISMGSITQIGTVSEDGSMTVAKNGITYSTQLADPDVGYN